MTRGKGLLTQYLAMTGGIKARFAMTKERVCYASLAMTSGIKTRFAMTKEKVCYADSRNDKKGLTCEVIQLYCNKIHESYSRTPNPAPTQFDEEIHESTLLWVSAGFREIHESTLLWVSAWFRVRK